MKHELITYTLPTHVEAKCSCLQWGGKASDREAAKRAFERHVPTTTPTATPKFGYAYIDRHTSATEELTLLARTSLTRTQATQLVEALLADDAHLGPLPEVQFTKRNGGGTFSWPTGDHPGGLLRVGAKHRTAEVLVHEAAHWRHYRIDPNVKGVRGKRSQWHGAEFVAQLDKLARRAVDILPEV